MPLILAWAMGMYESQGQTLDRVKVDLGRVFEKGHVHVALSRAISLEGLQVSNLDPAKVIRYLKSFFTFILTFIFCGFKSIQK